MSYNSRTADKFVVRLPDGVREHITALAKDQHVSMNTWIIQRIEEALSGASGDRQEATWYPRTGDIVKFYDSEGEYIGLTMVESVRLGLTEPGAKPAILVDSAYYVGGTRIAQVSMPVTRCKPL